MNVEVFALLNKSGSQYLFNSELFNFKPNQVIPSYPITVTPAISNLDFSVNS